MKLIKLHFEELESTSDWAIAHAHELDAQALTCITTDKQTKGRGRHGRTWQSLPGNITVTLCFSIKKELPNVGQLLALCTAEMVEAYGISLEIKWPNDLLAKGKKLGGVLTEVILPEMVAVGLGLNIEAAPKGLELPAISLKELAQTAPDAKAFLNLLIERFIPSLELFKEMGFAPFCKAMNRRLAYKGEKVAVTVGEKITHGILQSISEGGTLLLTLKNGEMIELLTGDIKHLRRQ